MGREEAKAQSKAAQREKEEAAHSKKVGGQYVPFPWRPWREGALPPCTTALHSSSTPIVVVLHAA